MNIIDMLKDNSSDNNLSNQIAIKCEIRNIEKRVNYFIDDILNFIADKNKFINKNLSYCPNGDGVILTTEQKNMLNKEVEKAVKSIPGRLTSELNKLYGEINNQPEKKEEEKATVVATVTPSVEPAGTVNYFGY